MEVLESHDAIDSGSYPVIPQHVFAIARQFTCNCFRGRQSSDTAAVTGALS